MNTNTTSNLDLCATEQKQNKNKKNKSTETFRLANFEPSSFGIQKQKMKTGLRHIRQKPLQRYVVNLLRQGLGCSETEADAVAYHLVRSNLTGHDSHGVGMLPRYFNDAKKGLLVPNAEIKVDKNEGFAVVVDGQRGFGQRVARGTLCPAMTPVFGAFRFICGVLLQMPSTLR